MRKKMLWIIPVILLLGYAIGPSPASPVYDITMPRVPSGASELEQYIAAKESQHRLKPDNQARIVWADSSTRSKTPYAIVYLHGFSASQGEGEPIHRHLAKKFGCNLYLSRLSEHGIDTVDAMIHFNSDRYWESAKEALAIGRQLGDKVILIGTSTGGTLALMLAAQYPQVQSLVLLSPNIAINDSKAWLLNNHWGQNIAKAVLGSDYIISKDARPLYRQYWTWKYRVEAAVQLEELLETKMTKSTFQQVKQPTLTLYYYRDKVHQDSVVSVEAIKEMVHELGTPGPLNISKPMPKTGNHVLGSYIKSKDTEGVEKEIEAFMRKVLHLQPVS